MRERAHQIGAADDADDVLAAQNRHALDVMGDEQVGDVGDPGRISWAVTTLRVIRSAAQCRSTLI